MHSQICLYLRASNIISKLLITVPFHLPFLNISRFFISSSNNTHSLSIVSFLCILSYFSIFFIFAQRWTLYYICNLTAGSCTGWLNLQMPNLQIRSADMAMPFYTRDLSTRGCWYSSRLLEPIPRRWWGTQSIREGERINMKSELVE